MKRVANLETAKNKVYALVGKPVVLKMNRGRNRVKVYKGVLMQAYPNVFVVNVQGVVPNMISCSYVDMLCGEAMLLPDTK